MTPDLIHEIELELAELEQDFAKRLRSLKKRLRLAKDSGKPKKTVFQLKSKDGKHSMKVDLR